MHSCCLASELDGKHLDKFEQYRGTIRILESGQHLFRNGEKFHALYAVRSGMVKASITAEDGMEQVTGFYLPGEILGMDGIENNQYHTTAVALETCSICVLPFRRLTATDSELPGLQNRLWNLASREIAASQDLLMYMGRKDAEARIAGFLLSLSQRFKRIGYSATSFHLPMSRHDIGNYLGMTLETVSRVLTRFEKAGIISKEKRNITILDSTALSAVSVGKPVEQYPAKRSVQIARPSAFTAVSMTSRKHLHHIPVLAAQG